MTIGTVILGAAMPSGMRKRGGNAPLVLGVDTISYVSGASPHQYQSVTRNNKLLSFMKLRRVEV
jgi:hypothetical protein